MAYVNLPSVSTGGLVGGAPGGAAAPGGMDWMSLLSKLAGIPGLGGWSALASIFGGLLNRPRDPMEDYRRTAGLTYGAETPTGFAQGAFTDWMGSPAYRGLQRNLFGQQQGFSNQLQGSLANRGLLNSGLGNVVGALGSNLYGGNLSNLQGQAYQGFLGAAPDFFRLRQSLAGMTPRPPSFQQGLGAGLQGLGNFGLQSLLFRNVPPGRS